MLRRGIPFPKLRSERRKTMQFGFLGRKNEMECQNIDFSIDFTDRICYTFTARHFQYNGRKTKEWTTAFKKKAEAAGICQCMALSTCNRSEIYFLYEEESQIGQIHSIYQSLFPEHGHMSGCRQSQKRRDIHKDTAMPDAPFCRFLSPKCVFPRSGRKKAKNEWKKNKMKHCFGSIKAIWMRRLNPYNSVVMKL